jgi:hypothetical protein
VSLIENSASSIFQGHSSSRTSSWVLVRPALIHLLGDRIGHVVSEVSPRQADPDQKGACSARNLLYWKQIRGRDSAIKKEFLFDGGMVLSVRCGLKGNEETSKRRAGRSKGCGETNPGGGGP